MHKNLGGPRLRKNAFSNFLLLLLWQSNNLQKGAYVEVEGELRYREYTPTESERSVRTAEIYATSILALDRSVGQTSAASADSELGEEPVE